MNNNIFLDSNVFIYAADKDSLYYKEAVGFIRESLKTGLYTADVCIIEFFQVITDGRKTPKPFTTTEAILYIRKMFNAPDITILDTDTLYIINNNINQEEIIKYNITRYSIYDYLIATCLKQNDITKIATFNSKDFRKYSWLCVVDPRTAQGTERNEHNSINPLESSMGCPTVTQYAKPIIPYGRQSIDEKDVAAVCSVLRSDWLTQGPMVERFENELCRKFECEYAVAVNNGTTALHLAYLALGIKQGERVITSPNTFVATGNGIIYCGGIPVFVDIDERTFNLSTRRLELFLSDEENRKNVKGITVVHFAGQPCEIETIQEIAKRYNLWLLEDACHAPGARWCSSQGKWEIVGSCSHSDAAILSFHPVKHFTTGEGGAVLTNREDLADKVRLLRSHGITKNPERFTNKDLAFEDSCLANPSFSNRQSSIVNRQSANPWYYEMQELGYNGRITDFQCALGTEQLSRLSLMLKKRGEIAQEYNEKFSTIDSVTIPHVIAGVEHAYHLYVLQARQRRELFDYLQKNNISPQVHYIPVHAQPYYQKTFGYQWGDFPVAEKYYEQSISLPMYPQLKVEEQAFVIEKVKDFYSSCK